MDTPVISIVFSFRNEEEVLPELVHRVVAVVETIGDYELIFVNDDSTDRSLDVLQSLRAENSRIKIINMSRRFGVSPCVIAGLAASRGDAAIYMDSDLQDPPEIIPQMVREWKNGADIVHTVRTHRHGESAAKMWITKMAYKAINAFSDISLLENAGDFKLLSRRVVEEILQLGEMDPYLRGLSVWVGFNQAVVKYERDARSAGQSKFGLFTSLNPYKEFLRGITSFSTVPLYFALFFGLTVSMISFVLLCYIIVMKIAGMNLPGWTAIMSAILFLSGVILGTIGLLGIYVGRIYDQVRSRPKYIIKKQIGF
ncbi:MAG: glycosyltransferase family 2 protein [Nitrospirae bacterium]|nr:glycosyltransferase family 2 protein [Nitrospirota bacterium]